MRGHRDSGRTPLASSATMLTSNDGNFKETLRLMVDSGDLTLKTHLESAASNALYTSSTVQNDLLQCIGEEIQEKISRNVGSCGPYSILFDETTDLSHTNIMCFLVRYVDSVDGRYVLREDFLDFCDTYSAIAAENLEAGKPANEETALSGKRLGSLVISKMKHHQLDFQWCVGIGTDGCSVMTSEAIGAVTTIKEVARHAQRCHCFNHELNLSLQKCSTVREARNTLGVIQEIVSFFTQSAKRNLVLIRVTGGQLRALCATRWVERYKAILEFAEKLPKIVIALEEIHDWSDKGSSSKANLLLCGLRNFQFIVTLNILRELFSITTPLSVALQNQQMDVSSANELVQDTVSLLKAEREDSDNCFAEIFSRARAVAVELQIPQGMPRIVGLQVHRSNPGTSSPEDHYRLSIYIPLLDEITNDLEERFNDDALYVTKDLVSLMPTMIVKLSRPELSEIADSLLSRYETLLSGCVGIHLIKEILLWQQKWKRAQERPSDVLATLDTADSEVYPAVHFLLKVLAAMPVSVASAERSFSTLRRVKTYLRTTMTEERLASLALINIHRDYDLEMESIINRFAHKQNRRVNFIL